MTILRNFFVNRDSSIPLSFEEKEGITELIERIHDGGSENPMAMAMDRKMIEEVGFGWGGGRGTESTVSQGDLGNQNGFAGFSRSPSLNPLDGRANANGNLSGFRGNQAYLPTSNAPQPLFGSNHQPQGLSSSQSFGFRPTPTNQGSTTRPISGLPVSKSLNQFPFSFSSERGILAKPSSSVGNGGGIPTPYRRKRPLYLGPGMSGRSLIGNANNGSGMVRSQSAAAHISSDVNVNGESGIGKERDGKRRKTLGVGNGEKEDDEEDSRFLDPNRSGNRGLAASQTSPDLLGQSSISSPSKVHFGGSSTSKTQSQGLTTPGRSSIKRSRNQAEEEEKEEAAEETVPKKVSTSNRTRTANAMLEILGSDLKSATPSTSTPSKAKSDLFNPYQSQSSKASVPSASAPSTPLGGGIRKGRLSATPAASKERERLRKEREASRLKKEEEKELEEKKLQKEREEERERIRNRERSKEESVRKEGLLGRVERSFSRNNGNEEGVSREENEVEDQILNGNQDKKNKRNSLSASNYSINKPKKPSPLGMMSPDTKNSNENQKLSSSKSEPPPAFSFGNASASGSKDASTSIGINGVIKQIKPVVQTEHEVEEVESVQENDEEENEVEGEIEVHIIDSDTEEKQQDEEDDEEELDELDEDGLDEVDEPDEEDELEEEEELNLEENLDEDDDLPSASSLLKAATGKPTSSGFTTAGSLVREESKKKEIENPVTSNNPFSFKEPVKSTANPFSTSNASTSKPFSSSPTQPTSTFLPPSTPTSKPQFQSTSTLTPKDEAKSVPLSSLPSFNFTINSSPDSSTLISPSKSEKELRAKLEAKKAGLEGLPTFDFMRSGSTSNPSSSTSVPSSSNKTAFNFMPIPTAPDPASATASTSTEVSPEDDVQSSFADQGEGEEAEISLYETRGKVYAFTGGAWKDSGIGMIRIKKDQQTGKKRLLVRHEANKKVLVVSSRVIRIR